MFFFASECRTDWLAERFEHMLRSRRQRREQPCLPEPVVILDGALDPEQEALLADSVGPARHDAAGMMTA